MPKLITYHQIMHQPIFRMLHKEQLADILNEELHFKDYDKIYPNTIYPHIKASLLMHEWNVHTKQKQEQYCAKFIKPGKK